MASGEIRVIKEGTNLVCIGGYKTLLGKEELI